jgi:hypothetical protein
VRRLAARAVALPRALEACRTRPSWRVALGGAAEVSGPLRLHASVGHRGLQRFQFRRPAARVAHTLDRVQAPQQACGGERRETHGVLTLLLRKVVRVGEAAVKETRRPWTDLGPLLATVPPHRGESECGSVPERTPRPHRGLTQKEAS